MVFLRKVKTASGANVVQIVERKNRRDVALEHLGCAHTEAELAALMSAGRDKMGLPHDQVTIARTSVPYPRSEHEEVAPARRPPLP